MVKDLKSGQTIKDQIFYCVNKKSGVSSKGDNFLSLSLRDSSGVIEAKIWDVNTINTEFNAKDFVIVSGTIGTFREALQLNISDLNTIDKSLVNISDFCPVTSLNIDEMLNEIKDLIDTVTNEHLKLLLDSFFNNDKFISKFTKNSAAKSVHHAYIGGLIEHSLYVTKICDNMCKLYSSLNRDLLITVALLHDIGKIKEISAFPDNDYTDDGQLLGHIYMGAEMIEMKARNIDGFPRELLNEIKHCILAHHGKKEYGSPVLPSIIEAAALNIADETDAKMRRWTDLLNESNSLWTDNNDFFLGTRIRKTIV